VVLSVSGVSTPAEALPARPMVSAAALTATSVALPIRDVRLALTA
jgi:hypothetical protein